MILILCTGNATRSVIAGAVLAAHLPDVEVVTSGTLSIDGLPMSWRTRAGFEAVGVTPPAHRSRQVQPADLDRATLVIGLAPEHVEWVRREHPSVAPRTATLKRLARDLPADARPLAERVAALDLAAVQLAPWEEVVDPGGGEVEAFIACAQEVVALVDDVADRLRPTSQHPMGRRQSGAVGVDGRRSRRPAGAGRPKCCSPPPGCGRARRWSTSAAEQARRRGEPPSSPAPPAASSVSTWHRR